MTDRPPQRWGKINHGQTYGLIADDIARRIATLKMGHYEVLLLNHIREYSWARSTRKKTREGAWPDAIPFVETVTATAAAVCGPIVSDSEFKHVRKKLYEAVATLKADHILIETEGETPGLLINTNVAEWKTYLRDFLPPGSGLRYACQAQNARVETPENSPETTVSEDTNISPPEDTHIPPRGYAVSPPEDTRILPRGYAHIEERGRVLDLIQTEEDNTVVVVTPAKDGSTDPKPPTNLDELREWAAKVVPPLESLDGKLAGFALSYPIPWIHDAILCAIVNTKPGGIASFANGCLRRWQALGGPPHAEVEPARIMTGTAATSAPARASPGRRETVSERIAREGSERKEYLKTWKPKHMRGPADGA